MPHAFRLFTEHPRSVGETYGQHMAMATSFGTSMIVAGFACLLHGLFPFLFKSTGSRCVTVLYGRMVTHRSRVAAGEGGASPDLRRAPVMDGAHVPAE